MKKEKCKKPKLKISTKKNVDLRVHGNDKSQPKSITISTVFIKTFTLSVTRVIYIRQKYISNRLCKPYGTTTYYFI